jgi:hypothetical protein
MQMHDVRLKLSEDAEEILACIPQASTYMRLHNKSFRLHLLAQLAKSRNRIDARVMPLISLQTAHL